MTSTIKDLQYLIERIRSGEMPSGELRRCLRHRSPLVRANALEASVASSRLDESLLQDLINSVAAPTNKVVLMGTISVAHIAVGCLFQIGTSAAVEAARGFLISWPEPDRSDLIWYLSSKGLGTEWFEGQASRGQ
jgi:hypothetical protein